MIRDTKFNKGEPAPDFVLSDVSGKKYTLADFAGKKILIDLGASWCGPCIAGIPEWNNLVDKNRDNHNIVFLAVSLDDKVDDWNKMLKKYQIKGMKLFAGGGFSGVFAKTYEISSIPHLLLLDGNGKFIEYAASHPGTDELYRQLLP